MPRTVLVLRAAGHSDLSHQLKFWKGIRAGNYQSSPRHPDWDALIAQYVSGDLIYCIDCTTVDASKIVVGSDFYALAREGVVIAHALEVIYD